MCDLILKQHTVKRIVYFTAQVKPRPDKPTAHTDQMAYVTALGSDPRIRVIWGQFLQNTKIAMRADNGRPVKIKHVEEKGSDVNLAVHLLFDASQEHMNEAVVISNDSDLVEAIRLVRKKFHIPVGVLNPHAKPSHALVGAASWVRPIREGVLAAAQFPEHVEIVGGPAGRKMVRRPAGWDQKSPPKRRAP